MSHSQRPALSAQRRARGLRGDGLSRLDTLAMRGPDAPDTLRRSRNASASTTTSLLERPSQMGRLPQRSPSPPPVTGFDLFQERTNQLLFWFDGWSPHQRQLFLGALLAPRNLRQGELDFLQHKLVDVRSPIPVYDFLALLPHHVALRIFSMLDPRSLSRAAQVNHMWSTMASSDQIWRPKALRMGWPLPYSPSPFENGAWKSHYIHTAQSLARPALAAKSGQLPSSTSDSAHHHHHHRRHHHHHTHAHGAATGDVNEDYDSWGEGDVLSAASHSSGSSSSSSSADSDAELDDAERLRARIMRERAHRRRRRPFASAQSASQPPWRDSAVVKQAEASVGCAGGALQCFPYSKQLRGELPRNPGALLRAHQQGQQQQQPVHTTTTTLYGGGQHRVHSRVDAPRLAAQSSIGTGGPAATQSFAGGPTPSRPLASASGFPHEDGFPAAARMLPAPAQHMQLHHTTGGTRSLDPLPGLEGDEQYPRVLLLSSAMLLNGVLQNAARFDVLAIPYEYAATTPASLLARVTRALNGRTARSIGIVCRGRPGAAFLVQSLALKVGSCSTDKARSFLQALGSLVVPAEQHGQIHLFVDNVAGSAQGLELLAMLERSTGRPCVASNDVAGKGQWLAWIVKGMETPPPRHARLYFNQERLMVWQVTVERASNVVRDVQRAMLPAIRGHQRDLAYHIAGEVMGAIVDFEWTTDVLHMLTAVSEGLDALKAQPSDDPIAFLAGFLLYFGKPEKRALLLQGQPLAALADGERSERCERPGGRKGKVTRVVVADSDDEPEDEDEDALMLRRRMQGREPGEHGQLGSAGDDESAVGDTEHVNPVVSAQSRESQRASLVAELVRSEADFFKSLCAIEDLCAAPLQEEMARVAQLEEQRRNRAAIGLDENGVAVDDGEAEAAKPAKGGGRRHKTKKKRKVPPSEQPTMTRTNFEIIFNDLARLHEISASFLTELREVAVAWSPASGIGSLFVRFAPALRVFVTYVNNWDAAVATLERCAAKSADLRALLCQCRESDLTRRRSLPELMLLPVQRIVQYDKLLERMALLTNEEHPDAHLLADARKQLRTPRQHIEKARNGELAYNLEKRMLAAPRLLEEGAQFVTEAEFVQVDLVRYPHEDGEDDGRGPAYYIGIQDVVLCLFTNSLVVASRQEQWRAFGQIRSVVDTFVDRLPLEQVIVTSLEDTPTQRYLFNVRTPKQRYTFRAPTLEAKLSWLENMSSTMIEAGL